MFKKILLVCLLAFIHVAFAQDYQVWGLCKVGARKAGVAMHSYRKDFLYPYASFSNCEQMLPIVCKSLAVLEFAESVGASVMKQMAANPTWAENWTPVDLYKSMFTTEVKYECFSQPKLPGRDPVVVLNDIPQPQGDWRLAPQPLPSAPQTGNPGSILPGPGSGMLFQDFQDFFDILQARGTKVFLISVGLIITALLGFKLVQGAATFGVGALEPASVLAVFALILSMAIEQGILKPQEMSRFKKYVSQSKVKSYLNDPSFLKKLKEVDPNYKLSVDTDIWVLESKHTGTNYDIAEVKK